MTDPWYKVDQVRRFLSGEVLNSFGGLEWGEWMTKHLNLAFEKGRQIGAAETDIECLRAENAELRKRLEPGTSGRLEVQEWPRYFTVDDESQISWMLAYIMVDGPYGNAKAIRRDGTVHCELGYGIDLIEHNHIPMGYRREITADEATAMLVKP